MPDADFDEAEWPCAPVYEETYRSRCARGLERMAGLRVVLCGLARNVGAVLPVNILRAQRIAGMFRECRIIVYENDSADDTPELLRAWAAQDPRVTVLSEKLGQLHWGPVPDPARMRHMASYRNQYRRLALQRFGAFDHLLVLDWDMLGWSYEGLSNSFGHDDWDVIGANGLSVRLGRPIYFDAHGFRALGHPTPHHYVAANLMVFPRGTPLVPVLSCFGGLALYRMAAMRAAEYEGDDCEHVTLHRRMRAAGFDRCFLNPSMITLYPDHSTVYPFTSDRWWHEL